MLSSETLTPYEFLSLVVSALGFVAVVVSLVFLMKQTAAATEQSKYVADSLTSSNYASIGAVMFSVNQVFIDHPELRPYFYDGENADERNPDYARILAVAERILDYFSYILILSYRYPRLWPPNWWASLMEERFVSSPAMREHLRKTRELYVPELYDMMLKVESRLESPSL